MSNSLGPISGVTNVPQWVGEGTNIKVQPTSLGFKSSFTVTQKAQHIRLLRVEPKRRG